MMLMPLFQVVNLPFIADKAGVFYSVMRYSTSLWIENFVSDGFS
jgi:hypothetical protein